MLENWVIVHVSLVGVCRSQCTVLLLSNVLRENGLEHFLEAAKYINWSSFSFWSLEEIFSSWVKSLVWVLSWSSSASSTCWWISLLTIWAFGMLLLHMCIKSGIGQIGLVTVFALEISAGVVVLGSSLATSLLISVIATTICI